MRDVAIALYGYSELATCYIVVPCVDAGINALLQVSQAKYAQQNNINNYYAQRVL